MSCGNARSRCDAPFCLGRVAGGALALLICVADRHRHPRLLLADIMAIRCKGLDCDSLNFSLDVYGRVLTYLMRMSQVRAGGVRMSVTACLNPSL